ncbi:tail assembly chaperone [Streptomyces phage Goby]|uniref:Tail assembly chaperone n=3 Tax=Likavirus TaxID=1982880 RepID=R4T8C8_9CAUD|nr:tail assembly chaperone [Streptomyces phage Lika]YP_008051419.1 tail assembly chaperone [Streptomyces phage Sujidade]YP_010056569.1 tail assembly chaperone [Streptomyces phage Goby]AWN07612.1 tail assembly chaperone [Streptomyces phage Toma]AGM12039.1 tail assembly chaperone [Streptomyces phage Lika]AGM12115.1 tail assembly chaperone [Streptomyces phage Sujidade]AWN07536.1 tail assembly chaperone [Streptomyces phage Goby]
MASYSLDSIREAAEAKYGSTDIDLGNGVVRLLNPLRLPKTKRDELATLQDKLEQDGVDQETVLGEAILLVAESESKGKALLKAVGGDLAVLAEIFETYGKGTQVGGSLSLARLVDDYGEGLYPDLRFYYGIDLAEVIAGRGPSPSLVILLVQRLPDTSLTAALASGGREQFGWGVDRHMTADIFDALNQNTRATGNWGKKGAPKLPEYPRPKVKKSSKEDRPKKKVRVADLFNQLSRR